MTEQSTEKASVRLVTVPAGGGSTLLEKPPSANSELKNKPKLFGEPSLVGRIDSFAIDRAWIVLII